MENILKTKQLTVFGPNENRLDFLKYIYKIISGYPPDYKSEFDNQIVAPYKYSCL